MSGSRALPLPDHGRPAAEAFVADHLGHLVPPPVVGARRFRGGQSRAEAALAGFDVTGYAAGRNEVWPEHRRAASALSPYIRHGLLTLRRVWDHVDGGPERDVAKFRDELAWQEYARHWYARLGRRTRSGVRCDLAAVADGDGWDRSMACLDLVLGELDADGWIVNQSRMWLASEWAVRRGVSWRAGEDRLFRHLLDGSRAANRLGWQWTVGVGSGKPYGFARSQVERRAPGTCDRCGHRRACPIEGWPDAPGLVAVGEPAEVRRAPDPTAEAGPVRPDVADEPDVVWLTAESLGLEDPALAAHPEAPAVFVFDEPLLATLGLSAARLVFLVETLAELARDRRLELHLGRPVEALADRQVAVTFAPVPGFAARVRTVSSVALHPWPWLARPAGRSVRSFSAWRKQVSLPTR